MTAPRATEDGETWPKDTSGHRTRRTSPVRPATQVLPQTGTDAGDRPRVLSMRNGGPQLQGDAEPDRTMNYGVLGAIGTTTTTTPADYLHDAPVHPDILMTTIHTHPRALY